MARKRRTAQPCEYCDGDHYSVSATGDADDLVIELYPGHMISASTFRINSSTEETEEIDCAIPMNYCPCCGRKLVE